MQVAMRKIHMSPIANMRPKEAAKFLGVGLSSFWLYVKQGRIQTIKLSERVTIVKASELEAFIERAAGGAA